MAVVLNTQVTLDPANQIAHLVDITGLLGSTQYVIAGTYLQPDTRFTFLGVYDITLTKPPVGVPAPSTTVAATISTVPLPAPPPPPAKYPYGVKDRLLSGNLNLDLSSSPGATPPTSAHGPATQGKFWLDTSVAPATLRICAVPQASVSYVAGEWTSFGPISGGGQVGSGVFMPLAGDSTKSGALVVTGALTANSGVTVNSPGGAPLVLTTPTSTDNHIVFNQGSSVWSIGPQGSAQGEFWINGGGGNRLRFDTGGNCSLSNNLTVSGGISTSSGISATGNIASSNTVQGLNIIAVNNFAGPANYTFYGPGFDVATSINFNASLTAALGNFQVNGTGIFVNTITVGGLTWQNNGAYMYTPSGLRSGNQLYTDGPLTVIGDGHFSASVYIGGTQLFNNGGYVYTPNGYMSAGTIQGNFSGNAFYAPNGNVYVAGTYNGPHGANIQCWAGGSWGSINFTMISGGYLGCSPDGGASGFNYAPNGSFSDARLKENITDTQVDALAAIMAVPVRAFEWNEAGRRLMPNATDTPLGLVAQEVEETIPFVVTQPLTDYAPIGDMRLIEDHRLIPYFVRAIQQLTERVALLEGAPP